MPNYYNAPPYQSPYTNAWGQTALPNGYQSNYIQTNQSNQQPNLNNIMVVPAYMVQNPNCCASVNNYGCGCNG